MILNIVKNIAIRVLFIILIIIVIFLLAFAIFKFIPVLFSGFASVGNVISSPFRDKEVAVSVNDPSLIDGDKFQLSWDFETEKDGQFYLTYKCVDGLKLNAINDSEQKSILCNTQYSLPANSNSQELEIIYTAKNSFVDLPLEVSFIENGNNTILARGEAVVTIQDSINPTPVGTNAGATLTAGEVTTPENTSATGSGTYYNPIYTSVPADLAIINADPVDDLTVQFVVRNTGGQNTGNWYFTYSIPGEGTETSPLQPNLKPGETIKYTIRFDSGTEEGKTKIVVDPYNSVAENNESNNQFYIDVEGGNGSGSSGSYAEDDDADLEIDDLKVGRMSGSRFIEDDEIDEDDDAAVQFTVTNRGGERTGSWRFEVTNLPYDDDDDFESKKQDSLAPGESVVITVEFENPDEGDYKIRVEVDSRDDVDEEKENNNKESETLEVED